jgi:hypothetical protein
MKNYLFIVIIFLYASCTDKFESNPIKTTSIYTGKYPDLIEALKDENLIAIERITKANNLNLNYTDSVNGLSLLTTSGAG